MDGAIIKFVDDLRVYLASKIPDIPQHERDEIAAFVGYKTSTLIVEAVTERDKQWVYNQKKQIRAARRNKLEEE